ncbi:hypothetical protein BDZ89DRAFT_1069664 [Hymenopellis radicata]|nr:hypothetical protein BDZ89DRAFT_1069664 [Hymenopellis radicata]
MESSLTVPTDKQVLLALDQLKTLPGRPKLLALLKSDNSWSLSDARLRKLINQREQEKKPRQRPPGILPYNDLHEIKDFAKRYHCLACGSSPELHTNRKVQAVIVADRIKALPPPSLPNDALAAQLQFFEDSTRVFILYGRGKFNYAATPNASVGIMLALCRNRMLEFLKIHPSPSTLNKNPFVHTLFEYYEAAGIKAGLPAEDVGRQFEAEWGVNPLEFRTEEEKSLQYRAFYNEWKEERHKLATIRMNTSLFYSSSTQPETFKLDENGFVAYDVRVNGRFALIITKVDKRTGQECGNL